MKHYIVDITYTASLETIDELVNQHRTFLQSGYERGWLLMSGPKNPRTGGIIIARVPSLEDLKKFFDADPYFLNHAAEYTFTEFLPVKAQPMIESWITGTDK